MKSSNVFAVAAVLGLGDFNFGSHAMDSALTSIEFGDEIIDIGGEFAISVTFISVSALEIFVLIGQFLFKTFQMFLLVFKAVNLTTQV